MKYRIEQCNKGCRTLWVIKSKNKVLSCHETQSDAMKTVQSYIEDDRWNAANPIDTHS